MFNPSCPLSKGFPRKNAGVGFHFLLQGIFLEIRPRYGTCISCTGRQIFHHCTTVCVCVCVCVCVHICKVLRSIKVDVEKWAKKMKIVSNFIWILGILPGGKGPRQYSTCEFSSVYTKHEETGFLHTCHIKMPLIISTFSLFVSYFLFTVVVWQWSLYLSLHLG